MVVATRRRARQQRGLADRLPTGDAGTGLAHHLGDDLPGTEIFRPRTVPGGVRRMSEPAVAGKSSAWQAFAQPSAWTMFFFGFASGLPFLLVAGTLAYWLKEKDITLKDITLIASAGLAYTLKFVWAPLVDRWRLPLLGRLGQRRGWLLLAQIIVIGGLLGMAQLTPDRL